MTETKNAYPEAVRVAREYYNSNDADRFYFTIWGGQDIHIGIYETPDEDIAVASQRTVEVMAKRLGTLRPGAHILDMGAGYGGTARALVRKHGCTVLALNLSEVENRRDRELNAEAGLTDAIEVVDGSFEAVPADDASFEVVWSQDAFLHGSDRSRILDEAARVMKPGAEMVFGDPMQADDCPEGVLQPILDRLFLPNLGSPAFYRAEAKRLGLEDLGFEEHTDQLVNHYRRVLAETERRQAEIEAAGVSRDYIHRMKKGLRHWIEGGEKGWLAWGVFHLRKPA